MDAVVDSYVIDRVGGLRPSERREVVFLTSATDAELNAYDTFRRLDEKRDRLIRDRFDIG